jgi:BASS family bile acid:Na+ symporter
MQPKSPGSAFLAYVDRYFFWVIVASYFAAMEFPGLGLWIRRADLGQIHLFGATVDVSLPLLMLAALLFNAGLGVRTQQLRHLARQPCPLIGGQVANLLTPLAFIVGLSFLMKLWHNPDEVQQILVGLALVASMPIAGASTAWAQNANGNLALSLGLVLLTTMLSPLLTPLALHSVGFVTTGDYSEDLHELAVDGVGAFLGVWVILPSRRGIAAHAFLGVRRVAAIKPGLKATNYVVLALLNYGNGSLSLPGVRSSPDFDLLTIMVVIALGLCCFAFASGYLVARLLKTDRDSMISLVFGLGMNNNGTGLVLASVALADHPGVMLPIIFYNLVQHLVASSVLAVFFARPPS